MPLVFLANWADVEAVAGELCVSPVPSKKSALAFLAATADGKELCFTAVAADHNNARNASSTAVTEAWNVVFFHDSEMAFQDICQRVFEVNAEPRHVRAVALKRLAVPIQADEDDLDFLMASTLVDRPVEVEQKGQERSAFRVGTIGEVEGYRLAPQLGLGNNRVVRVLQAALREEDEVHLCVFGRHLNVDAFCTFLLSLT